MTAPVRRKWRGVEPDARTAERRERLINTAIDVLASDGLAGTTVRSVCARAKLHSRYFYESFDDLDALLVAVFDELGTRFLTEVAEAAEAADDDPAARLHAAMDASVAIAKREPHLLRILTVDAIGNEQLNRRRIRMIHDMGAMIEHDAYRTYGVPPAGERIGAVAARFLVGGLAEVIISWVDGELEGSVDDLARDAFDLVVAFADASSGVARDRAAQRGRPRRA